MGALSERDRRNRDRFACDPEAIAVTMLLGLTIGVTGSVAVALGSHLLYPLTHPGVAQPALWLEVYVSTLFGLLFSLAGVLGAAGAVAVAGRRLRATRSRQAAVAAAGAVLAVVVAVASVSPAFTIAADGFAATISLVLVAASAFGLMLIRASAHTMPRPTGSGS